MVISEVVPSFCLAFSYKEIDEMTKLTSREKTHLCYLWWEFSLEFPCFLTAKGKIRHTYNVADCLCFSTYFLVTPVLSQGHFGRFVWCSLYSVLKGSGIEIGFCSLWLSNRELLVRLIGRRSIICKMLLGKSEVSWTQEIMQSSWQLHRLNLSALTANSLPLLLSCSVC